MKAEHKVFCKSWLSNGFNASAAYRTAYPTCSAATAGANGQKLLQNATIREHLAEQSKRLFDKLDIDAENVVRLLWETATADPNELVEVRRDCCRFCHGRNHRYQMTPAEWEQEVQRFGVAMDKWVDGGSKGDAPVLDDQGGIGFNRTLPPVADCPECAGEGMPRIVLKDTRNASPAAKRLYAGAKRTNNGIEIVTHSRDKNLELVGRYLSLFVDKLDHRSGDGSMSPIPPMPLDAFYGRLPDKPGTDT